MEWFKPIYLYSSLSNEILEWFTLIDYNYIYNQSIKWVESSFMFISESMIIFMDYMRSYVTAHNKAIIYFSYITLGCGLFYNLVYSIQIPLAALELFRKRFRSSEDHTWWLLTSDITMPISIIIPAYNEEVMIVEAVISTLATQYPSFEVIIVNDGSTDTTLESLIEAFDLKKSNRIYENTIGEHNVRGIYTSPIYSNLIIVDKKNGGRSAALNTGIVVSRNPLFCTLDADSLLDPNALIKTVQPFIDYPEKMVASGGTVRILNGCEVEHGVIKKIKLPKKFLPLFQVAEYMRAFLMGRLAWSHLGIVTILSGAFSVIKRDFAIKVGGYDINTIGEDFELVMKIHKYCLSNKIEYDIQFIPEPVCWTEVPEDIEVLRSQRIRWQQGGLEVFFKHREMLLNPKYGRIGMLAYPLIFVFDVIGPIIELCGYVLLPIFYMLDVLNIKFFLAFVCLFFVFGVFISTMSLILEELSVKRFNSAKDLLMLGLVTVLENFGYRQYNNIWRIVGWWRFLRKQQIWGHMKRVGFKKSA